MGAEQVRILLVEDTPGDARLLREMLAERGRETFRLEHVERISDALARLSSEVFDAILLDLSLPDGQGLETVDLICRTVRHVPVVVLTGLDDETLALNALQHGAQDYLVKGHIAPSWLRRALRYAIERHRMWMALRSLALLDELTGLYNRRGFATLAREHFQLARRTNRDSSFVFLDVDDLKHINDTRGHQEGDRALVQTAEILRHTFRQSDILGRVGGDEFAVLVIHAPHDDAQMILPRVQDAVRRHNAGKGGGYPLSLSLGVVPLDRSRPFVMDDLMATADQALYEHKQRNRCT